MKHVNPKKPVYVPNHQSVCIPKEAAQHVYEAVKQNTPVTPFHVKTVHETNMLKPDKPCKAVSPVDPLLVRPDHAHSLTEPANPY